MKNYLILVRGTQAAFSKLADADRGALFEKWGAYIGKLTAGGHWVGGAPLESSGRLFCDKRQPMEGVVGEEDVSVTGYMILQAADYDAAIGLCDACPSLDIGGKLEIREAAPCDG